MTLIEQFEADCERAGVKPSAVVKRAGMAASTWFRWKSGEVSPTVRSLDAARDALDKAISEASDPASPAEATA